MRLLLYVGNILLTAIYQVGIRASLTTVIAVFSLCLSISTRVTCKMCKISLNKFCFVCGSYIFAKTKKSFSERVQTEYGQYFGIEPKFLSESWTPKSVCGSCSSRLNDFSNGIGRHLPFYTPMMWRNPIDHVTDCYFCLTKVQGGKNGKAIYPNVQSVTKAVPHTAKSKSKENTKSRASNESAKSNWSQSSEAEPTTRLMSQLQLNDLCRDLQLSKANSELLASRLQQLGYLDEKTRVTFYRNRSNSLAKFFSKTVDFCYCNDVPGLFAALGERHDADEWRLFIDGSKYSVKAVLLHKGNQKPSIPIGYSASVKESYATMEKLLQLLNYEAYKWKICCDLKVVGILTGLQAGFTKYGCFICLWDTRARERHYTQRIWPPRCDHVIGESNISNAPLVDKNSIILPALHIKLGLMKNFVKALNPESDAFEYLKKISPKLSIQKIKAGIFIGPQIRKLFDDIEFQECLSDAEEQA